MELFNKVIIAGAVGVAVAVVANYCWNWWKKGDKGKGISIIVPASETIPLMPESVSLKEQNNVKVANPVMVSDSETLKEAVKEIPLAPRFIIHCNEKKPQRGIYRFEVDEIGPVDALIDTGATACVVRRDVLPDSMKSKIEPLTGVTATLFDGISKIDILGYVFLSVSYLDQNVKLPFFVVAEPWDLPMILGNNWIRKSRAILQSDGTKLAVTFGGKEEKTETVDAFYCSSPYVSVNIIDGIDQEIKALVDTGTKRSFIRSDILTEPQKEKAIPTSNRSAMANNAEIKGVQEIISLNISFGGVITCIEDCHIISKMDSKLLVLGMDWIDKTHAVIQSDGSEIFVSLPD